MKQHRSTIWSVALLCEFCWQSAVVAQEEQITGSSTEQQESDRRKTGPRSVPCFEAIDRASSKQLEDKAFANLPEFARFWLTEDVVDLISPEERCAFLQPVNRRRAKSFHRTILVQTLPRPNIIGKQFQASTLRTDCSRGRKIRNTGARVEDRPGSSLRHVWSTRFH